ncbi:complex i intermediate-associated protein mitochondrial precursor [Stemphylium lycopersici]|uniref:Complex i intermediate-associated protein mitochondrial n=1 Tax=Stemphylium lycopersici TaxID=183478 RepID=A0A364N2A1_STELY|nr:complex i intermediate-associated protein mitochondrial precursor [Stemphylium lycopersici]
MPSHLTRVVFRNLIANEPLLYRGCRHRAIRPRTIAHHGPQPLPRTQRRTFFGNLFKQQRKLKPAETPAGLEKMTEVAYAKQSATRPPPPAEVAEAIKDFFALRKGTFEDFHVASAYYALQYLQESPVESETSWLSRYDLEAILEQLLAPSKRPNMVGEWHVPFGRMLIDELERWFQRQDGKGREKGLKIPYEMYIKSELVKLLSLFGAATEARQVATSTFVYDSEAAGPMKAATCHAWENVLEGSIRESDPSGIEKTVEVFQDLSVPLTSKLQSTLVSYYAERGELDKAKFWYAQPIFTKFGNPKTTPSAAASSALLVTCASRRDLTFGQQVVASLLKDELPAKESWDAIFLWSVAIGKGPDEINRMMDVLVRRNDEARREDPQIDLVRPDIDTINALVEYCMSKHDPYSAERYITLGEKRGILPDETTYAMQIAYRISVGDLDGARAAYFNLQGSFSGSERSVAAVNQLIQALCVSKLPHFDELMAMVDDLHERKANFAPETVAALTLLHLRRGEIPDAMDLLQVHAHQYAPTQRRIIQKALSMFLLDSETSTADAWDAYQIMRNVFIETPREDRITVMNNFFARNRADMACHVFFHMRNHIDPAHTATKEVYAAAFTGFARCADAESLELAHNQLRLDLNVEMDTQLRNSLMLAYAATGENRKALRFWRDICESKEGPSYNSILIAFRACEGMHFGSEHAKSIWKRLKEQDIDIDKAIWTAYMSAIARNHNHDEALALIETVEEEYGFTLDLHILGSWFNCTANSEKQTHVEAWIKQRYPLIWGQMEALGHWVTMEGFGYRQYKINRDLNPSTHSPRLLTFLFPTLPPNFLSITAILKDFYHHCHKPISAEKKVSPAITTMRVTHLVTGLLGLAGLSQAAPVSDDPHPVTTLPDSQMIVMHPHLPNSRFGVIGTDSVDQCVKMPDLVAHQVTFLRQHIGYLCRYFDQGCDASDGEFMIDAKYNEWAHDIRPAYGTKAGFVRCTKWPSKRHLGDDAIETRNTNALPGDVVAHTLDSMHTFSSAPPAPLHVGEVYVCAEDKALGCDLIPSLNTCSSFGPHTAYQSNEVTQAKGTFCKYYTAPGCMDGEEYFRHQTNPKQDAILSGWGMKKLAGVWCFGTGHTFGGVGVDVENAPSAA